MKDITQRIDEILSIIMAGAAGVRAGRKSGIGSAGKKLPAGARFGKLDDLYMEVLYHQNKNHKEAVEDIIKQKNLDRKTAKALKKLVKKKLG